MLLRDAIKQVQDVGKSYGFHIIIVGGALVRLIGSKTTIKNIDTKKKIIFLEKAENPDTTRSEDAKTTVDIDAIAFSDAVDPFTQEVRQKYTQLHSALKTLCKTPGFPAISVEPVLYHPYFPKPHQLTQFVSSVESYHPKNFFFRLGDAQQDVTRQSLDFWTYAVDHEQIVSLSPLAIQRRYTIRGFAIKPKDKEKIWGSRSPFAQFVQEFRTKTHNTYEKDFAAWDLFAKQITHSPKPSMQLKKALWNTYWQTIGTYLAHGTGLVGKMLLPLGNTFFAGK